MGTYHRWAAARGPIPLGSPASALSVYNFRVSGREAQCDRDVLLLWGWGLSGCHLVGEDINQMRL